MIGRADGDLLPREAARELARACAQVAEGATLPAISLAAEAAGEPRRLTIFIERIEGGGRSGGALLLTAPDPGRPSQAERPAADSGERVAAALLQAIGLRDRFLLEQTCRLRSYARAVGLRLGLDARELAVLELSASLSHLGNIFLPDWLLAKAGPRSPEETRMMHAHFQESLEVMSALGLALPVVEVVAQMHERQDGSGFPQGLRGDQIGLLARVLGAIEAFCARTAVRGGQGMSPGQALYDLAREAGRFDIRVISALAAVVAAESQSARARAIGDIGSGSKSGQMATEAAA